MPSSVDYWERAVKQVGFLKALSLILAIAVAGLSVAVALPLYRGTPIHYIPPGGPGLSRPGELSEGYAADFASRWLRARYSFTPETIQAAHKEIIPALHPTVQDAFRKGAEQEARKVRAGKLGSHLTVLVEGLSTKRVGQEVLVGIVAIRSIYKEKVHLRDEEVRGVVGVVSWVGEGHQRGAMITRVELEPKFGEVGE